IGPALPYGPQIVLVPSGPDLHLDAPVALAKEALDLLENPLNRRLDPEAYAGVDLTSRSAERLCHRGVLRTRVQVPAGHFQAGLGEIIASYLFPGARDAIGMIPIDAEHARNQKVAQDVPGRLGGLGAVVGIGSARALAPALGPVLVANSDQDVLEMVLGVARGGERPNERQAHQEHLDRSHRMSHATRSRRYRGWI